MFNSFALFIKAPDRAGQSPAPYRTDDAGIDNYIDSIAEKKTIFNGGGDGSRAVF